jgi:hypothetical protein
MDLHTGWAIFTIVSVRKFNLPVGNVRKMLIRKVSKTEAQPERRLGRGGKLEIVIARTGTSLNRLGFL